MTTLTLESLRNIEQALIDNGTMTHFAKEWIDEHRRRLRPRTPQELRREFDAIRRHCCTENECLRGEDERLSDRQEELRKLLLNDYPEMMGDYIESSGLMVYSGERSDVFVYYESNGTQAYYEIWSECIEQGVLVRCKKLVNGETTILRCGTAWDVPGGEK